MRRTDFPASESRSATTKPAVPAPTTTKIQGNVRKVAWNNEVKWATIVIRCCRNSWKCAWRCSGRSTRNSGRRWTIKIIGVQGSMGIWGDMAIETEIGVFSKCWGGVSWSVDGDGTVSPAKYRRSIQGYRTGDTIAYTTVLDGAEMGALSYRSINLRVNRLLTSSSRNFGNGKSIAIDLLGIL